MVVHGSGGWKGMLAAALLALLPGVAAADPVKLGYVEFPPYTQTEGGTPKGSLIEAFAKVAAEEGIAFTAESVPARRLFQGLAEGEFHVFLGIRTVKELEGTTIASAAPIGRIELNAYGLGTAPSVTGKEDLAGKAVIVLSGYSYAGWRAWMDDPANKVAVVEARTPDQALNLLKAGRAPVLLQYSLPMAQALAGKTVPDLKSSPVSAIDIFVVVSKKAPGAEALLAKLEAGFARLGR